jgi:hypothetical protein
MIIDFMPLDTGWFPLCTIAKGERPNRPAIWAHTESGIYNSDKTAQIHAYLNPHKWNRLIWTGSKYSTGMNWYLNGTKIGSWAYADKYGMDLLLEEDAYMYLLGSSDSSGIRIKVKAIYNFDFNLSEHQVAEFSIPLGI